MPALFLLTITYLVIANAKPPASVVNSHRKPVMEKPSPRKPATAVGFRYILSADEWATQIGQELPSLFCDDRGYFTQCFDIDKATCTGTVQKLTTQCLKRINVPKKVRIATHGIDLGHFLGRCIGVEYEKSLLNKKKTQGTCRDGRQWF